MRRPLSDDERSTMTVLQIALLVGAGVAVWLVAVVLIVVWVMGMSRNAAVDEEKFHRDLLREKARAARSAAEKADKASA
jgi:biopolymer transport protein ExbB/TolQ